MPTDKSPKDLSRKGQPETSAPSDNTPSSKLKTKDKKSAFDTVKDWWSIAAIGFAIIAGYIWLEANFAKIDKLNSEKCNLSYEIRITRAELEFQSVDEDMSLQRSELEDLLTMTNPPQKRVEFKQGYVASLEDKLRDIGETLECLRRAKEACFQNDIDTSKCYE